MSVEYFAKNQESFWVIFITCICNIEIYLEIESRNLVFYYLEMSVHVHIIYIIDFKIS